MNWKATVRQYVPRPLLDRVRRMRGLSSVQSEVTAPPTDGFHLPQRTLEELFPGIGAVPVTLPASQIARTRDMVLPLAELLTLGAICNFKAPGKIFEIGTYTGSTTLAMAMNSPAETSLFTLDLDERGLRREGYTSFTVGSVFQGAPEASKITQLRGDSRQFDFSPYHSSIDCVLVDANHTYEAVTADSKTALALVREGGIIIWDDYRWDNDPACAGVAQSLHELNQQQPIFNITGTRLAIAVNPVK